MAGAEAVFSQLSTTPAETGIPNAPLNPAGLSYCWLTAAIPQLVTVPGTWRCMAWLPHQAMAVCGQQKYLGPLFVHSSPELILSLHLISLFVGIMLLALGELICKFLEVGFLGFSKCKFFPR